MRMHGHGIEDTCIELWIVCRSSVDNRLEWTMCHILDERYSEPFTCAIVWRHLMSNEDSDTQVCALVIRPLTTYEMIWLNDSQKISGSDGYGQFAKKKSLVYGLAITLILVYVV